MARKKPLNTLEAIRKELWRLQEENLELNRNLSRFGDMLMRARISDTAIRDVRADGSTHSLQIVSYGHHEIHSGSAFCAHLASADFDKNDEMNICFTTPNTDKWLHMIALVDCTVPAIFDILQAATVTNGSGTPLVVLNRNRNSAKTSGVLSIVAVPVVNTVSTDCTIVVDGTAVHTEAMGGGKKSLSSSGVRDNDEYILMPNTVYAFRIKGSGVTDNGVASMELTWYEHQDKD